MSDEPDDRRAQDIEREMGDEADGMEARVEELDKQVADADSKAQPMREQAGHGKGRAPDEPSGEIETPAVSEDGEDGDADPGDPLEEVTDEDDVAPGDEDGDDEDGDDEDGDKA
ncbi:MAG: hypothetical protein H0W96_01360 [Solirubrobacterales bacterium]|nr:hypothetical protein [Solirubrobacterales bacterium]